MVRIIIIHVHIHLIIEIQICTVVTGLIIPVDIITVQTHVITTEPANETATQYHTIPVTVSASAPYHTASHATRTVATYATHPRRQNRATAVPSPVPEGPRHAPICNTPAEVPVLTRMRRDSSPSTTLPLGRRVQSNLSDPPESLRTRTGGSTTILTVIQRFGSDRARKRSASLSMEPNQVSSPRGSRGP